MGKSWRGASVQGTQKPGWQHSSHNKSDKTKLEESPGPTAQAAGTSSGSISVLCGGKVAMPHWERQCCSGSACTVCKQRGGQNKMSCFTEDATRYHKKKKKKENNGLVPLLTFAFVQAQSFEIKGCIMNVWTLLIWKVWSVYYCFV